MEELPIVGFGKYKDKPITELLNDTKYLEWCKQQEWFKNTKIYNIVVNQTIQTNVSSKTPEHNKIQNLFLNNNNTLNLINYIYNRNKKKDLVINEDISVEFETKFNWDLMIQEPSYWYCVCDWNLKKDGESCDCKYNKVEEIRFSSIYCEIKPLLGDDYPNVLRKMKTQKTLTVQYLQKENEKEKEKYLKGYCGNCKFIPMGLGTYILLVNEFTSSTTSKEELISIFKQSHIDVIFISDIIKLDSNKLINKIDENKIEILIQENKILKEQNEELLNKINLLKEEKNNTIMNNKSTKTIKDYFK